MSGPVPSFSLRRPRLPSHYYVRFEPPDGSGDEGLIVSSQRRRIKLKGKSLREFWHRVVPLLDGRHTVEEIQQRVSSLFPPDELMEGLQLLAAQHLLQEADLDLRAPGLDRTIEPQLNAFHELGLDAALVQRRLAGATVAIVGLGGAGAYAALALAAAGTGEIRCVDSMPVGASDPYLAPCYAPADGGMPRAEVVARRIAALGSPSRPVAHADPLQDDAAVRAAVEGAAFVVCCLDAGLTSIIYKLNRVCWAAGISWTSCTSSAFEGVLGPTVVPGETACYMCYRMRGVACSDWPEDDLAFEQYLDRRQQDDSGRRENLVFGSGAMGNLVGLEALKVLTGAWAPAAAGGIIVIDFLTMAGTRHIVLRKPWCPTCYPAGA